MSGLKTQWNDEEDRALDYLPHRAQVCYLRGLRRYMDYKTGVVGIARFISYKGLAEVMEVRPCRGSKEVAYTPTKDAVRAVLKLLERKGLVVPVARGDKSMPLVFKLPLACSAFFRSVEEHHMNTIVGTTPSAPLGTPYESQPQGFDSAGFSVSVGGYEAAPEHVDVRTVEKPDEHHTTGYLDIYSSSNNNNLVNSSEDRHLTPMSADWRPSNDVCLLVMQNFNVDQNQLEMLILDFRNYWLGRKGERRNWDVAFKKNVPKAKFILGRLVMESERSDENLHDLSRQQLESDVRNLPSVMSESWSPSGDVCDVVMATVDVNYALLRLMIKSFRAYWLRRGESRVDWDGLFTVSAAKIKYFLEKLNTEGHEADKKMHDYLSQLSGKRADKLFSDS